MCISTHPLVNTVLNMLVVSKYSYFHKVQDGSCIAYSSKTNALLRIPQIIFDLLSKRPSDVRNELFKISSQKYIDTLLHEGILCEENDDRDYLMQSQFFTQVLQHNKTRLNLILVPTLNCNFCCSYCFEHGKRQETMTDQTVDDLITFINKNPCNEISLCWYGGEPLLEIGIIQKILSRIHKETIKPIVRHTIITNGVLFDENAISLFERYQLNSVQITLDGRKKRHDAIRFLKSNHSPTFDSICDNIEHIVKRLLHTKVLVRVNVDKTNISDFGELRKELIKRFDSKNVLIYPGLIRNENADMTDYVPPSICLDEAFSTFYDFYKSNFVNEGKMPLHMKGKTCGALCVNSFIVGPQGEIYKCWNDVSDKSKIVGYINNERIINPTLYYRYHESCAWYNDEECKECFFLPICHGKCAWYNIRNIYNKGKYKLCQCPQKAPGMLDKYIEDIYNRLTK